MSLKQFRKEIAIQTRMQVRFERKLAPLLYKEFKRVGAEYEKAVINKTSLKAVTKRHKKRLYRILSTSNGEVIRHFMGRVIGAKGYLGLNLETKREADTYTALMAKWIAENLNQTLDFLSDGTLATVKAIIKAGKANGDHSAVIGANINNKLGGKFGKSRAVRIARTETHTAANFAGLESAKRTGLDLVKVWGAAEDSRTRSDHAAADLQKQEIDDHFIIGGEKAQYAGDTSLSAGQRINCRCTTITMTRKRYKRLKNR